MTESRLARTELVRLLSDTLGHEKASDAVDDDATRCGFGDATHFTRPQLMLLLERMAASPGLVGIVARFAKVRIILLVK